MDLLVYQIHGVETWQIRLGDLVPMLGSSIRNVDNLCAKPLRRRRLVASKMGKVGNLLAVTEEEEE